MELLRIRCPTCNARLKVRDARLLGQIVHCPKCGSMMQVDAPSPATSPETRTPASPAESSSLSEKSSEPQIAAPEVTFPTLADRPVPPEPKQPPVVSPSQPASVTLDERIRPYRWLVWGLAASVGLSIGVGLFGGMLLVQSWLRPPVAIEPVPAVPEPAPRPLPAQDKPEPPAPVENSPTNDEPIVQPSDTGATETHDVPASAELSSTDPEETSKITPDEPAEVMSDNLSADATPYFEADEPSQPDQPTADETAETATEASEAAPAATPNPPPPLPTVNLQERLAQPIAALSLSEASLGDAVELLAKLGNVWVSWDLEALSSQGVALDKQVQLSLTDTTLTGAFEMLLTPLGLVAIESADQLRITRADWRDDAPVERSFDVSFAENELPQLPTIVTELCSPSTWQSRGGVGEARIEGNNLIVHQRPREMALVAELLKLWQERRQSTRTTPEPPLRQQAARCLQAPVTASFFSPTPLHEIVGYLAATSGCRVIIDAASLRTFERLPTVPARLSVNDQPLEVALTELLAPIDLGFRLVDAGTIEIVPRVELRNRPRADVYPLAPWVDRGGDPAELQNRLSDAVDSGRQPSGGWHWDPSSRSLIVVLDEPGHAAIEGVWRELTKPAAPPRAPK